MQLTPHFALDELVRSQTAARDGINNAPPPALYPSLLRLCEGLERIRARLDGPIQISSGYRSPALNKRIGGAANSQHVLGLAADINVPGMTPRQLAELIAANPLGIGFDQMILEFGEWVHVSFGIPARGEVLTIRSKAEGYRKGLLP